mgnify:CR=1 FL=1
MTRIDQTFAKLKAEGRGGLVTFITAGDPDYDTSLSLLKGLPGAGADIVELGMPFSDPMADGPAIQASSLRALKGGQTLRKTLEMVRTFREKDDETPIVLMGYYNPIYSRGVDAFLEEAKDAGIDGLIVVDLPPEEDDELCIPAQKAGLNFIRLATPTTDDKRLPKVLQNTSGFVYYVSITGITGAAEAQAAKFAVRAESVDALIAAADNTDAETHPSGTYVCMEGPQFSTYAESCLYRSWGMDVIGIDNNLREYFFGSDGSTHWMARKLSSSLPNYRHRDIDIRDQAAVFGFFGSVTPSAFDNAATAVPPARRLMRRASGAAVIETSPPP